MSPKWQQALLWLTHRLGSGATKRRKDKQKPPHNNRDGGAETGQWRDTARQNRQRLSYLIKRNHNLLSWLVQLTAVM